MFFHSSSRASPSSSDIQFLETLTNVSPSSNWEISEKDHEVSLTLKEKKFWQSRNVPTLCQITDKVLTHIEKSGCQGGNDLLTLLSKLEKETLPILKKMKNCNELKDLESHLEAMDKTLHYKDFSLRLSAEERLSRLLENHYGDLPKMPGDSQINQQLIKTLVQKTDTDNLHSLTLDDVLREIRKAHNNSTMIFDT